MEVSAEMPTVICVKCDRCGRLGTKDMQWVKQINELKKEESEVMLCYCGNMTWKFVEREGSQITPDVMVVNEMGVTH